MRTLRPSRFLTVLALLLSVTLLVPSAPVSAQDAAESEIRTMLESRDQQIKSILNGDTSSFSTDQREELKTLINGVIDFRAMGQVALGPFWTDLSDDQKTNSWTYSAISYAPSRLPTLRSTTLESRMRT